MRGTITSIDIMYDLNDPTDQWVRAEMPSSIPTGVRGVVYIVGRNDMATPEYLGVHWTIRDPLGTVISSGEQWPGFMMSPGKNMNFGVDQITFSRLGTWELEAELLMNPGSPEIVDTYSGPLCEVVWPGAFEGNISEQVLKTDQRLIRFPHTATYGRTNRIVFWGHNAMDTPQEMGIQWTIKDPQGVIIEDYSVDPRQWLSVPADYHAQFTGKEFVLDAVGTWTIKAYLLMNPADPITVDRYLGTLCTVVPEEEPVPPDEEGIEISWPLIALAGGLAAVGLALVAKKKT